MLSLPELVRIYICAGHRHAKEIRLVGCRGPGLAGRYDPLSGHLFVFRSRRGDRVKLLWWDKDGLILYYRRLERRNLPLPGGRRSRGAEHRSVGARVVAGAVGHRPGQREAAATLSAHGLTREKRFLLSAGIIWPPRASIRV